MTATPGWSLPATPDPAPVEELRPVMRQCQLCLRRGPDLQLTAEQRQASALGHGIPIPPDAVSSSMVRWHDPLPGKAYTREFRCEDHDACWRRVVEFGDAWPVDDARPRRLPREGEPGMTLAQGLAEREVSGAHGDSPAQPLDAEPEVAAPAHGLHGLDQPAVADDLDWSFGS